MIDPVIDPVCSIMVDPVLISILFELECPPRRARLTGADSIQLLLSGARVLQPTAATKQ